MASALYLVRRRRLQVVSGVPVGMAVAPVAVPLGVLIVARILGASWPLAIVAACVAIPVVWFATHQQTWAAQPPSP